MKEMNNLKFENYQFELLFKVNGCIVCQRYFNIKGKINYNAIKSLNVKWLIDDCVDLIFNDFKQKSVDFLWNKYNPYIQQTVEDIKKSKDGNSKERWFILELYLEGKLVGSKIFNGLVFVPSVQYECNIRHLLPSMIDLVQDTFTLNNSDLVKNYGKVIL